MSPSEVDPQSYDEETCGTNYAFKDTDPLTRMIDVARFRWNLGRGRSNVVFEDDLEDSSQDGRYIADLEAFRASQAFTRMYSHRSPMVSVCVTTADRPQVLRRRALSSLVRQSYRNLQIIVVGDHCDDRTGRMIEEVNDPRVTYINLPQRGPYPPPGPARWMVGGTHPANEAMRHIRGDFVTHLDDDDTFSEGRIADLVKALQESGADIVHHPFWWERDDKSWIVLGNGNFVLGQTGTSMIMYNRWFAQIPWNINAFRFGEPGDWNRFKKFARLRARISFVNQPLTWHWHFPLKPPLTLKEGESFIPV